MAIFGFCIGTFGVAWQSAGYTRNVADIAFQTATTSKLFTYSGNAGSASSFLMGATRTGRFQEIPDTDLSGRLLPLNLNRKYINLEIPGGFHFERKLIKLTIRNSGIRQEILYEWEGFLLVRTASPADFNISGQFHELSLSNVHNRRNFGYIIESGSILDRHRDPYQLSR